MKAASSLLHALEGKKLLIFVIYRRDGRPQVFQDRVDNSGKAGISHVLIWSFQESLTPHAVIISPWEVRGAAA